MYISLGASLPQPSARVHRGQIVAKTHAHVQNGNEAKNCHAEDPSSISSSGVLWLPPRPRPRSGTPQRIQDTGEEEPCAPGPRKGILREILARGSVSERLRRWTRSPLGSAHRGSSHLAIVFFGSAGCWFRSMDLWAKACWPKPSGRSRPWPKPLWL